MVWLWSYLSELGILLQYFIVRIVFHSILAIFFSTSAVELYFVRIVFVLV